MPVRWETTKVEGKDMRMYIGVPERPGPHPGIVVAQHNSGVDAQIQDVVHRLHREGYVTAAPELFHRQPPGGELTPQQRSRMLVDNEVIADVNATIAHLKNMRLTVAPLGIVGFCMRSRTSATPNATGSAPRAPRGRRCWRSSRST